MSDVVNIEQQVSQLKTQETSTKAFSETKARVQNAKKTREGIRPSDGRPFNRNLVDEFRHAERFSEQGDKAKETGFEEIFIDRRGYQDARFQMHWTSPDGQETVAEDLVFFVKGGENGQIDYLTGKDGKPTALNADLYDSKLHSSRHAVRTDSDLFSVPRIDANGKFTGVVTLQSDKAP